MFWMAVEDLAKYFHELTICRLRRNFAQHRWPVNAPSALDAATPAFAVVAPAGEPTTLDAALLQRTERGVAPRGHHVMADAALLVFEHLGVGGGEDGTHAVTRKNIDRGVVRLAHAACDLRVALPPVVATGDMILKPGRTYALVPLCLNWRVLGIGATQRLTAVLYSSRPLRDVTAAGLEADALAAALRAAVRAKGARLRSVANPDDAAEELYELDGVYLAENHRPDRSLTVTMGLGQASNLVSSRHGGVIDPKQPANVYTLEDVLPPQTWQIVLARSPYRGSWSIQNTHCTWSYGAVADEKHRPPVPPGGLHACYPLPST